MSQVAAEQKAYEIEELWDRDWFTEVDRERFRRLGKFIPTDCRTMLDVGCGNGMFLDHVAKLRSWDRLCGVDRSLEALRHVNHEHQTADINSLPFEDNEFDIVSCQEVLEHLPQETYADAISELTRIARKAVLVSVPYNENLVRGQVECPYCHTRFHPDYHMRSFDDECMADLLSGQGFRTVAVEKLHPVRVSWHYHILHKNGTRRRVDFPSFAICPTCHYQDTSGLEKDLNDRRSSASGGHENPGMIQRLKRNLIPGFESYRWIAGLYVPNNVD